MYYPDQKRIELPYTFAPGESRPFVVLVGILVPPEVHELLLSVEGSNLSTVSDASMVLATQDIDLFGNEVNYQKFGDGNYLRTIKNKGDKSPTYWYQTVSGKGNVFMTSTTAYVWPK